MKPTIKFQPYFFILVLVLASLACSLGQPKATPTPAVPSATNTPVPTATPSVKLGEETRMADQGFSFCPLPGYELNTEFGVQMLAKGADPDTGPAFMVVGGEAAEGTDAASLIESIESSEVDVTEPKPIQVDGRDGLISSITRKADNLTGRVVAVMVTPRQQFVVFAMAPQAKWDGEVAALFDALLGSIKLFEMEAAGEPATAGEPAASAEPAVEPTKAPEPAQSAEPAELTEIRQWAASATASSQYGEDSWSATQATGAPNVTTCADDTKSWAAASSNTVEWIELTFAVPVAPSQVNVHISYNPTYITKMELIDLDGVSHQIYGFEARSYAECPTVFSIDVSEQNIQTAKLKITIDQSSAPSWVEIDAVELVGIGDASLLGSEPAAEPTQPAASFETPAGFMWRVGGEKAFDTYAQFPGLWGMDVDPQNGLIFIADAVHDVQVVDIDGNPVGSFKHDDMRVPQDVKVDALGNVYVAAWASGKVLVFPPMGNGDPFVVFGERGRGDGQFGDFSPTHLAVGLDGRIYVHDRNQNSKDEYYDRIQVFTPQGKWLQTIQFEDDFFTPGGMDIGPDGNLYVVGFIGSTVFKYSPDGEFLGELGEDAIRSVNGGAQGIALDEAGNIYLALWTGGIIKLDPDGSLLGQWAVPVNDGEKAWPEGGFYQPAGVAVLPDGSQVFFTDTSSKQAYLTAFTFNP
jgi:sugar lactone lactonase YvrE